MICVASSRNVGSCSCSCPESTVGSPNQCESFSPGLFHPLGLFNPSKPEVRCLFSSYSYLIDEVGCSISKSSPGPASCMFSQ